MSPRRILLLPLALLAGCYSSLTPAPYVQHGDNAALPSPGPHPDSVAVAPGDTLNGIAERYGLPVRAIIDANGLAPPYRVAVGQILVLPQVQTYLVRVGDTVALVARRYGVDWHALTAANHLAPPYVIRIGALLVVPAPSAPIVAEAPPPPPPAPSYAAAVMPPRLPPPFAAAPETAQSAATPPPVPTVGPPQALPPPPPRPSPVAAAEPVPPPPRIVEAQPAPPAPPPPRPSPRVAEAEPPPPAPPSAAVVPPVDRSTGFLWPVKGRIVSRFGVGADGTQNDGINIAAPEGTPVLAAAAGEVAYAGNELKGYGNLILIKHPDGYITAYADNSVLLVQRGEMVARGQPIARVGATGAVSSPQLHFEIRRGTRALDPAGLLPAEAAEK